jgi:hypothetical protein
MGLLARETNHRFSIFLKSFDQPWALQYVFCIVLFIDAAFAKIM